MKTKQIVLMIAILSVTAAGWWFFNEYRPHAGPAHAVHKDVYYCPMHPQITSDRPGNCPICSMRLVKKESSDEATPAVSSSSEQERHAAHLPGGYARVSMDQKKQQLIGIRTAPVVRKELIKTIRAYGYVAHDLELYDAQLEYIDAWLIYYSFQARRPVKDEFNVDWREYFLSDATQNRWRSDEKRKAGQRLIKAEYELRHMGLNDEQLRHLREIKYGQPWVEPQLLFFEPNEPVWVYAQVFENDLGFITVGQKAVVTIPAYGETAEGVVRTIDITIDPETRTKRVRIELPEYRGELSVNMYVDVAMPVELNKSVLVPREAILDTGVSKIVFVQTQEGVFEPRHIETGFEGDGMVAVRSGLEEGEMIVTSGNFLIDSESRLRAALEGMTEGAQGGQHVH